MTEPRRWLPALLSLLLVALAGAAAVSYTWHLNQERIERNERQYRLRKLNQILPAGRYDNDLFEDTTTARDIELLGNDEATTVYRARAGGKPVALILEAVAPQGYSGPIRLLVGINYDGTLAGVRASAHRETPGLGDMIDADKSDWILGFTGRALGDPADAQWKVRRDGGVFDEFTGATITPRAVVKAVRNALIYFDLHRDQLFSHEHLR